MDEETQNLGKVEMTGFKDIDAGSIVVLKKMASTYARRFEDRCNDFQKLRLILKKVHKVEEQNKQKFEIHAHVFDGGKTYSTEVIDFNLFVGVDSALKKIEHEANIKK